MRSHHEEQTPSPWVVRWAPLIRAGGDVLDVASGVGRHTRYCAGRGCAVIAVDRDEEALAGLAGVQGVQTLQADLEAKPWPFGPERFDAVVVANYLHRPLFPALITALRPGGVLIYETFMVGNERYGKPSNPNFLLRPGELLEAIASRLWVVAFEQGSVSRPKEAVVQRICAIRGSGEAVTI
jgi:SAM-dependent methyltransferase